MSITVTDRRAPAPSSDSPVKSTAQLYAALAKFQEELPRLVAEQTATVVGETRAGKPTSYKYNYANLGDISPSVLPLLAKHGLAWTAKPTMADGQFVLLYKLTHSSGEEDGGTWPLPDPHRVDSQKLGGAITYARRYALCAMTGIAPGKDDDDAQASRGRPAASAPVSAADTARADVAAVMEAQQLDPTQVVQGYYRRYRVDLRQDQDVAHLEEFARALRQDPDAALALDPSTGQPTRPHAVKDAS
jgi:hypothetical protein